MMDGYRRQQIQAKAMELLEEAEIRSLPIDPRVIAKHLGILVHAKPPTASGASGWLVRDGSEFGIVYATHISNEGFQNFSIAHELGHFWLDGHPEHVFQGGNEHASHAGFKSSDPIEQEADYFAACLLMPKSLCLPLISKSSDGMPAVLSLAAKCNTSLTASSLRYAEIGPQPVGVIQSHKGQVEFCAIYPLQSHVGWARPLARGHRVPHESATARLARDEDALRAGGEDSDAGPASDWFHGAKGRVELVEEVIGLGAFGRTLTLLSVDEDDASDEDE